jgi:ABC-type transport system involved in multi-copper enzyme maturation permease subunit
MSRVRTLMWKEFAELRQSPRLLALLIVAPIIQLTMLGYAATDGCEKRADCRG